MTARTLKAGARGRADARTWHGRVQLWDTIPEDGRGYCTSSGCDRELCYCERCVVPDSMSQVVLVDGGFPKCHECLKDWLGWGPGRRLHHCSTCTCVEQ